MVSISVLRKVDIERYYLVLHLEVLDSYRSSEEGMARTARRFLG